MDQEGQNLSVSNKPGWFNTENRKKTRRLPLKKYPARLYYLLSKYSPELVKITQHILYKKLLFFKKKTFINFLFKVTVLIGLKNGIQSLGYICILLALIFYIYAVAGILFLRDNDPWHFRSIEITMITLIRCSFFDVSYIVWYFIFNQIIVDIKLFFK